MKQTDLRNSKWDEVLEKLKRGQLPSANIGPAIVRLGKPFDKKKILAAKEVVASYLEHPDMWARHEAMWFLTSWGRLPEYQGSLIHALRHDPDPDNRGFAALCLAQLREGSGDTEVVTALKQAVEDDEEDPLTRLDAYNALREVATSDSSLRADANHKDLSDIDWEWVRSLSTASL